MAARTTLVNLIGKENYPKYFEKVVQPELSRLHAAGKISDDVLSQIASTLNNQGLDFFNPTVTLSGNNTLSSQHGGFVGFAKGELAKGSSLNHVVKQTPVDILKDEAIHYALVRKAIKGTDLQHMLPEYSIAFTDTKNREQGILLSAFLAGDLLYNKIHALDADKVSLLSQVVDEEQELLYLLKHTGVRFPKELGSFTDFMKTFSADEKFLELYDQDIGSFLDASRSENIHGDTNLKNILMNGRSRLIDWSHARGNGFIEIDAFRMANKANLSSEEEQAFINHVAKNVGDESIERYIKTKITYQLKSAAKYNYGDARNVAFTQAVKSIDDAIDKKMISPEFKDRVLRVGKLSYDILDEQTYQKLSQKNNINELLSLESESLQSKAKLNPDESFGLLRDTIQEGKDAIVAEKKKRKKRNRLFAGAGILAAGIIGLSSMFFGGKNAENRLLNMSEHEISSEISDHRLWRYFDIYSESFEEANGLTLEEVKPRPVFGKVDNFNRSDTAVLAAAKKHGIPQNVILGVFSANNLMIPTWDPNRSKIQRLGWKYDINMDWVINKLEDVGLIDQISSGPKQFRDTELFAPWLYYEKMIANETWYASDGGPLGAITTVKYSARENFYEGMTHFAKFWKENEDIEDERERIIKTAMQFYNPYNYDVFSNIGLVSGYNTDFCNIEYASIRNEIRQAVGTIVHGPTVDMGGLLVTQNTLYSTEVPLYCGDNYANLH